LPPRVYFDSNIVQSELRLSDATVPLPSVLWQCSLGDRNGVRPVKSWVLMYWYFGSDYLTGAFARLTAPVVTTTSIIRGSNKIKYGHILETNKQTEWKQNLLDGGNNLIGNVTRKEKQTLKDPWIASICPSQNITSESTLTVSWLFLVGCQYQCKWLTGKIVLSPKWCIDGDVKPYSLTRSFDLNLYRGVNCDRPTRLTTQKFLFVNCY